MNKAIRILAACAAFSVSISCSRSGIPDMSGAGVAAHYAASLEGGIIVAGGCNFPDRPPYEGGSKAYYDDILLLSGESWENVGRLPQASAYGAYTSDGKHLFIAGGAGSEGAFDSFISITLEGGKAGVTQLPSLPKAVQQGAAALDGEYLYLAGGFGPGGPNTDILRYDFQAGAWEVTATLPQALVQPVLTVKEGTIYIWGGYDPDIKKSVTCGYRFLDGAWTEIPGAPDGGTLVGSASARAGRYIYVSGGVNSGIFDYAITLGPEETAEYQSQPVEYFRFRETLYRFDLDSEKWSTVGAWHDSARAGAALILKDRHLISIGGEIKACVRDPRSFVFPNALPKR